MPGPRYWWLERADEETLIVERPTHQPPAGPLPNRVRDRPSPQAGRDRAPNLDRLRVYRAGLIRKAALQRRGSAGRKAVEARLVKLTAEILKLELRGER